MGTRSKPPIYQMSSPSLSLRFASPSGSLLDEDPGIMSEAETASTGYRREKAIKARSNLPVVRTPSKTLERPLGMVFLQYRSETKRALLPNEVTTLDTVKALFVRSFTQQLSMEYLDSPLVRIYIHDSNKDMFYELEDLRDVRDRSVLRLYETEGAVPNPVVPPVCTKASSTWDQDLNYFSEPEFDSEFQHQHVHKKGSGKGSGNFYNRSFSPLLNTPTALVQPVASAGGIRPLGSNLSRPFSPAPPVPSLNDSRSLPVPIPNPSKPPRAYPPSPLTVTIVPSDTPPLTSPVARASPGPRIPDRNFLSPSYLSPPDRRELYAASSERHSLDVPSPDRSRNYPYSRPSSAFDDPYSSGAFLLRAGSTTPIMDEDARIRMEQMERQLASLTGLVQSALTHGQRPPLTSSESVDFIRKEETAKKTPKLGREKCVSFEKSVSFSDEPLDSKPVKPHSPQHTESKPTKPAIKSSTLPRAAAQVPPYRGESEREDISLQENDCTPYPFVAAAAAVAGVPPGTAQFTPDMVNHLKMLQKRARDLRQEMRSLRRMSQAQAQAMREAIRDAFVQIRAALVSHGEAVALNTSPWSRIAKQEESFRISMARLESDLSELETSVEELRSNVINRKTRVNMSEVENMAVLLSKSSKAVSDLKSQFPSLHDDIKGVLALEMTKVMEEEKFLGEEPAKLENALRRCKKLTGTLVTLKRLASVQEQRVPVPQPLLVSNELPVPVDAPAKGSSQSGSSGTGQHGTSASVAVRRVPPMAYASGEDSGSDSSSQSTFSAAFRSVRSENALDALLDELQMFTTLPSSDVLPSQQPTTIDSTPLVKEPPGPGDPPSLGSLPSNKALRRLPSFPSSDSMGSPVQSLHDDPVHPTTHRNTEIKGDSPKPLPALPSRAVAAEKARRAPPPPPPPRTSSRSPLVSPTGPMSPRRTQPLHPDHVPLHNATHATSSSSTPPTPPSRLAPFMVKVLPSGPLPHTLPRSGATRPAHPSPSSSLASVLERKEQLSSNSSSSESINSQEGLQLMNRGDKLSTSSSSLRSNSVDQSVTSEMNSGMTTPPAHPRQDVLEQRHQELLRKQRLLQDQYNRLQTLHKSTGHPRPSPIAMGVSALASSVENSKKLLESNKRSMSAYQSKEDAQSDATTMKSDATDNTQAYYETDIL